MRDGERESCKDQFGAVFFLPGDCQQHHNLYLCHAFILLNYGVCLECKSMFVYLLSTDREMVGHGTLKSEGKTGWYFRD